MNNPYIKQVYKEIEYGHPKSHIIDTYKHLLVLDKELKQDLEGLEKIMCNYLIKED